MDDVQKIISKHNGKNLRANKIQDTTKNESLTPGIVYQASVKREDNNKEEPYIGLTNNTFKTRFTAHIISSRHQDKRFETTTQ